MRAFSLFDELSVAYKMRSRPPIYALGIGVLLTLSMNGAWANSELDDALGGFDEPAEAQNDLDEALEGFESSDLSSAESTPSSSSPSWLNLTTMLGVNSQFTTAHSAPPQNEVDWRGLQQLQLKTRIEADIDLPNNWKAKLGVNANYDVVYHLNDRDSYPKEVLKTQESEAEIFEAYVAGSLTDQVDLKAGRQIEVWGKSDSIRITDVINPLDNRQPGLVDIEDLRLPIFATKLTAYSSNWAFSLLALHEQRAPKEPAINGEFLPLEAFPFPPGFNFPEVDSQKSEYETTFAASAEGRFSGWDLSLYAARVQDSRWHFIDNKTARDYGLINMVGAAANFSFGGGLIKTEAAYLSDLRYNTTTDKKQRLDWLLGYDYMSIPDWTLSIEVADRYIQNYEPKMADLPDAVEEHNWQTAGRVSYSFDRDQAQLSYLVSLLGEMGQQGGFQRLWLDYDYSDHINLTLGYIDYLGGDHPLWEAMKNNDRVFAGVDYYF